MNTKTKVERTFQTQGIARMVIKKVRSIQEQPAQRLLMGRIQAWKVGVLSAAQTKKSHVLHRERMKEPRQGGGANFFPSVRILIREKWLTHTKHPVH